MSDGGGEPSEQGPVPETEAASTGGRSGSRARRNPALETAEFDERVARARRAIREGQRRVDPEMLLAYTTDRRDLHPSVQYQWAIWTSVSVLILTLIVGGTLSVLGAPTGTGLLVFVVFLALAMAWVRKRYHVWVYQVREDSLYLERGVVTHRRTHVPYVRIQHVDTSRGPLERWLGLSTLVVYTAGSRGADVSIPGLEPEEARDLQQRVKQLAIEAEGDDAL